MSIVTGEKLMQLIAKGMVTGIDVGGVSSWHTLDLSIQGEYQVEDCYPKEPLDVLSPENHMSTTGSSVCNLDIRLDPQEFILALTEQKFDLPDNITGLISLRSKVARKGLNQLTSIKIKSGFKGNMVLELVNSNRSRPLIIKPGSYIAQVMFFEHDPVKPYQGKYQDQEFISS
jgi:deoxycytidine triphosphate deaminase